MLTEYYDGTSWTELADIATCRDTGNGAGPLQLAAISWRSSPDAV
jgi:Ser/Thr protein kinase RdoA (MazF antagonist)